MDIRKERYSFAMRTVTALILIYVILMLIVTFSYADYYANQVFERTEKQAKEIADDLRGCRDTNPESVEYVDGFNRAQAVAIMRYYRFMKQREFKKAGVKFDINLYEAKSRKGRIVSLQEFRPKTPVLLSAPFSKRGKKIVFADTFSQEQMELLNKTIENGEFTTFIDSAKGYCEGTFFLPVEINIGENSTAETTIQTACYDVERKLERVDFQDIQVIGPQGRMAGRLDKGMEENNPIRRKCEEEMNLQLKEQDGLVGNRIGMDYNCVSAECYGTSVSRSGRYVLSYGAECKPLAYAISHLLQIYFFSAAVFLILGGILMGGHSKVLDRQWEMEEKRRRMMDAMAHDLKTPLGIIKNYGEVLLEEQNPQKRERYVKTIIEESDSMNEAVISMLDLSKMEAGTYPMELSSLSISELAEGLTERMEGMAERKGVRLARKIQPTERILADKKLLVNILSNFLSNALRHTKSGGYIELEVGQGKKGIRISVKNEGEPISAEEMAKIWNSFYRSDAARRRGDGGSGLGLAIVRNACLMHGGTYGCQNETDGVRFWAEIPSLEKGLRKAELQTGPVLNVTGNGYRLKGMKMVAAGLILQGLFSSSLYEVGIMGLFLSVISLNIWLCTAIQGALIFLGWLLVFAGIRQIKQQIPQFHSVFVVTVAELLVSAALELRVLRNYIIDSTDPDPFLTGLEYLGIAVSVVTILLMFRACGLLAKQFRDQRFYRKMIWKGVVYILLGGLYLVLVISGALWQLPLFIIYISWPGINLFVVWMWIQAYYQFHGREPLE